MINQFSFTVSTLCKDLLFYIKANLVKTVKKTFLSDNFTLHAHPFELYDF